LLHRKNRIFFWKGRQLWQLKTKSIIGLLRGKAIERRSSGSPPSKNEKTTVFF